MRGCVITGVWGAGKTSVLRRLTARLHENGCESLIVMPQAATITTHTYRPGTPHNHVQGIRSWLDELTGFLEALDQRFRASTLPNHRFASQWTPTCVLEGLGFDLPIYELPARRSDLTGVEGRLASLGIQLIVLRVRSTRVLDQCVISTRVHRGPKWARYLERFGSDDTQQALISGS